MRDPKRIAVIISKLQKIWETSPDLRFGQLFYIIEDERRRQGSQMDLFYYEDDQWEKILDIIATYRNVQIVREDEEDKEL